jgi:hypothetical protein
MFLATRSEPPLERRSSATVSLPTRLVVDARNDLFDEPVGLGEQSGKDRASPETHSECETVRRGRIRSHQGTDSHDLSGWHKSAGEIMSTNVQRISDAEYAAALAAGRIEAETEIRVQAVRYVPERDAIEIVTSRNAGFLIPRQWIGALQDVPIDELNKLEVWPDGSAIELEGRDIQISVHGLLTAILPAMLPSRSVAAIFASRGGKATSREKRKSSRTNGRKGGRPRKKSSTEIA